MVSTASCELITFDNIPAGTVISTLTDGPLTLSVQTTWAISATQIFYGAGEIVNPGPDKPPGDGVLQALPQQEASIASTISATFSQPVSNVSFDVEVERSWTMTYSFSNGSQTITRSAGYDGIYDCTNCAGLTYRALGFENLPQGFYLTSLQLHAADNYNYGAAIWLDNIAFTTVPEPSTLALMLLGTLLKLRLGKKKHRVVHTI